MKPSALILTTAILVVGVFACAPPQPPQAFRTAKVCTDGTLNKVPFLLLPFNPQSNQSPQPDTTTPINGDVQSDLTAAFSAAPAFQQQLCGLDGIFIDPTSCSRPDSNSAYDPNTCALTDNDVANHSWGLRVFPSGEKYITLSLGLWKNNSSSPWACQPPHQGQVCAPPFLTYQTRLVRALLGTIWPNVSITNLPQFVSVSPPSANISAMSVLATLAHEYGHVLWYDKFVPTPGGPASTTTPTSFCGGQLFYPKSSPYSWPYTVDLPSGRWLSFGEIRNQAYPSDVLQLPGLLVQKHYSEGGDRLHAMFTNQRWASALAAFSPDEDFVETFELSVLTNGNTPLTSLIISIPGSRPRPYQDDVLDNLNGSSELGRKYQCFGPLPQSLRQR